MEEQCEAHRLAIFPAEHRLDHRPRAEKLLTQLRLGADDQMRELLVVREAADKRQQTPCVLWPGGFDAERHEGERGERCARHCGETAMVAWFSS